MFSFLHECPKYFITVVARGPLNYIAVIRSVGSFKTCLYFGQAFGTICGAGPQHYGPFRTALALDSASGSVLSSEALSAYAKYAQDVKTTAGPS